LEGREGLRSLWHNWGKETERHINATLIGTSSI
jgi:hypothetical protein